MKAHKNVRLLNVFFPVWLILIFPQILLFTLPINLLVDSLVLYFALKLIVKPTKASLKESFGRSIWKVWMCGFAADIAASLILLLIIMIENEWWSLNVTQPLSTNPFSSIYSAGIAIAAVVVAGLIIFALDYCFALKHARLSQADRLKISIALAVATAPYLVLLPTTLFI